MPTLLNCLVQILTDLCLVVEMCVESSLADKILQMVVNLPSLSDNNRLFLSVAPILKRYAEDSICRVSYWSL